jgi:hypothetical protein
LLGTEVEADAIEDALGALHAGVVGSLGGLLGGGLGGALSGSAGGGLWRLGSAGGPESGVFCGRYGCVLDCISMISRNCQSSWSQEVRLKGNMAVHT